MFHPLHSYMYDVPGYPDLSCSSNMHIRVVSARFGFSKSSFSETNHPCVFDFTGQYSEGQCSASRLSLGAWGGFSRAFKKSLFFSINQVSQSFILHPLRPLPGAHHRSFPSLDFPLLLFLVYREADSACGR